MTKAANGLGSVYQMTNGKWRAAVIMANGKRRSRTAATQNHAKKALKALIAERDERDKLGLVSPDTLTVTDVIDSWLELELPNRNLAPSTVLTYGYCADNLKRELGDLRTTTLRQRDVDNAFTRLGGAGRMTKATLVKTRSVLAMAIDFAVRREEMPSGRNLARTVTLPTTTRPSKEGRSFTVEQAKALLAATAEHRWSALFVVALNLGLRPGELVGLTWAHIDLDDSPDRKRRKRIPTLSIEQAMRRTGTGKFALSGELKTARSRRTIVLPLHVAEALCRHRDTQRIEDIGSGIRSDLVFRTSTGTAISHRNLHRELRTITRALGFGIDWSPNEMRHTAASLLVEQGVSLVVVADILGHTTTRMLEERYRKNTRPSISGGVDAMSDIFG